MMGDSILEFFVVGYPCSCGLIWMLWDGHISPNQCSCYIVALPGLFGTVAPMLYNIHCKMAEWLVCILQHDQTILMSHLHDQANSIGHHIQVYLQDKNIVQMISIRMSLSLYSNIALVCTVVTPHS